MDSRIMISRPKGFPMKPLLLKDYLLDDLSSCSSNGFKSFPRRQCCTTVRFLLEIDLKNKQQDKNCLNYNKKPPTLLKSRSKSALSAFQSVIAAVKRLPFASGSSPEKKKLKGSFLPRSFSKKIFKTSSFWKKKSGHREIQRLKSFDELLKGDPQPSDLSNSSMTTTNGRKSNSWSGSDFTVECSSGNSSAEVNLCLHVTRNDVVKVQRQLNDKRVGVTNDGVSTDSDASANTNSSTDTKQKQWPNEEKEQFSPVSVLDYPFDDEDEVSSPFQHRLNHMEGTKKKLMKKIQRFECLTQLEPVNLAKRFTLIPDSDNDSSGSPCLLSTSSNDDDKFKVSDIEEEIEEEDKVEEKALQLLNQLKDTLPSYGLRLKADKLLLDFFKEKIIGYNADSKKHSLDHEELLEEAEYWIKERKHRELSPESDVHKNRQAYMKDMERGGDWKTLDKEQSEVGLELENEVLAVLLDELLLDISCKETS